MSRTAAQIHGGRTLLNRILRAVQQDFRVPKAIYDYAHWGTGFKNACSRWNCKPSDILAAKRLASDVGRWLGSFVEKLEPSENVWMADVEAAHEELIVRVTDRALQDMLLATFEGYQVPKTRRNPFTEVYGICLGMVRDENIQRKGRGKFRVRHVHVERAAVQLRARATKSAVWPNRKSLAAQLAAAESLFPHLQVLGDFHSHPYRKAEKLRREKGWEFSEDDYDYNREWVAELREKGHKPLVGFIVAIGQRKRYAGQRTTQAKLPHVKFLQVDRCLIALATYRILKDAWYYEEGIQLVVPTSFRA